MKTSAFTRSFTQSRTTLTLWYIAFCLALIALMNFGAFSAQTTSLAIPAKSIGYGTLDTSAHTPTETISIVNDSKVSTTTTVDAVRKRFGRTLMVADGILVILSVVFSYLLSSITLRPVRKTLEDQEVFAQEVSHELRTPLGVMSLELEALKRSDVRMAARHAQSFQHLESEIKRMGKLVGDMLVLVRPYDKNKSPKIVETFDITAAGQTAFSRMRKVAEAKHITYSFVSNSKEKVRGHRDDIEQVIGILLDNALKYTDTGGSVAFNIDKEGKEIVLQISDNGRGIAKKDLPHVFDRFYRADGHKIGQESEGLGLGLAIAQKRIAFHNGRIAVHSDLKKGTTVRVYIPLT
jgi:two-component system sensor histidine kinase CiaH